MDVKTLAEQGNAVNLVAASCLTCLLYDHAITLDQEVSKMWPLRMSIPKFLFFINRYLVEGMLLFNSAARTFQSEELFVVPVSSIFVGSLLGTSVVQGILMLRIWALHRGNKLALFIGLICYFGGMATLIGLVIKDYVGEAVFINRALDSLPGCYATSVPSIIAGFWIAPLIVESVFFILVISRAFVWWRNGTPAPRILFLLARDSTLYYAIVFAFLTSNYFVFQFGPPFLSSLLVTPSATAGCILGSHMILNLRKFLESAPDPLSNSGIIYIDNWTTRRSEMVG
ncbi:hypothetical protein BDQ17DRAFT_1423075 [Cyathus striatus]|nr:hypothetical protein BDQ17DRAFT_1423075 [Cyathus striatus]